MKLSEIVAELNSIKATISGWGKEKVAAAGEALTGFKADLERLQEKVNSELQVAQASVTAGLAAVNVHLSSLKISVSDSASLPDRINALHGDLSGKLATAQGETKAANDAMAAVNKRLDDAIAALSIKDVAADAKPEDKISAVQTAVSGTMAKIGVKPGDVPAAAAVSAAGGAAVKGKTLTEQCIEANKAKTA